MEGLSLFRRRHCFQGDGLVLLDISTMESSSSLDGDNRGAQLGSSEGRELMFSGVGQGIGTLLVLCGKPQDCAGVHHLEHMVGILIARKSTPTATIVGAATVVDCSSRIFSRRGNRKGAL